MLYLLWALINLVSGILLLFLCLRIFKWIRFKFGLVLSFSFLLLLVSLTSFSPAYTADAPLTWKVATTTNDAAIFPQNYTLEVEQNTLFNIQLRFHSTQTVDGTRERPLEVFCTMEGVTGSHRWIPTAVNIQTVNHSIHYKVEGFLEWKLLNCVVYREAKQFEGKAKL